MRRSAGGRDRAPAPRSERDREVVGRFATAVEAGDIAGVVALLADDAWLTMPPEPYEYQGARRHRPVPRRPCPPWRVAELVPTAANGQPAFGCYLPDTHGADRTRYGLMVLTLSGDEISAITWFAERTIVGYFGLPRMLPD